MSTTLRINSQLASMIKGAAFACTLVAGGAQAQPDPFRIAAPAYVDVNANQLHFPGDSAAWSGWHRKLDRLVFHGEGQLNVVHIGGSHVQADIWSQQARHRMQGMVPGMAAGRGLVFPYTAARTNNPYWYAVAHTGTWTALRSVVRTDTSTLGLTALSVTTRDSLASLRISFRTESYPGHTFDRVKVLHRMDSSMAVEAWCRDTTVRITKRIDGPGGYTEFRYDRYVDTLDLRFTRTDSLQRGFTLYGIVLESDDPGVVYHAVGANGASTASYLRCQRFAADLSLLHPDLVIFSVGINDAHDAEFSPERFKRNYTDLIARVRQASPDAAILLTTNTDSYFRRRIANRNGAKVRQAMLELGREQGVAVWDTYTVMGGLGSIATWERNGLARRDRIHFTRAGYTLLGDLLFTALMETYRDHLERSTTP